MIVRFRCSPLVQAPRPDRNAEQYLLEAFKVFDKQEDGLIPENDLRVIFTTLGETCDLQDVNYLLGQVKPDANGKIKYADFIKAMLR
jgi:Ca2+-binding EF-hand superfamily protein